MNMAKEVLAICPLQPDYGLVSKASAIAKKSGRTVRTVSFERTAALDAFQYGADFSELINLPRDFADDAALARFFEKKIKEEWKPDIILAPATIRFRSVMPILASYLHAGLTADCIELSIGPDGKLVQIRPAYGNNLLAWIETVSEIQMATVRPELFSPVRKERKNIPSVRESFFKEHQDVREVSFSSLHSMAPLNQADIVLAGGFGMGSAENFRLLYRLAKKTGASVGASRKAMMAGYAPYSCQIGQTGVTVHPRLYIAFGISGAVQHLSGMMGSGTVIAVNKDSRAPIFNYADYGITGDCVQILQKLLMRYK